MTDTTEASASSFIELTIADGIARVTLDRPDKRNAVTYEMWTRLAAICSDLATDPAVRVLVVSGRGDHFCAGADISGLGATSAADYASANEAADRALAAFPKPSIAFVRGSCVGGGAQIATACDLRIADTTARLGITPARLGILYPPFAIERTVNLIGASATKHLLYSAEIVSADRALRIGLIDELLEPHAARARIDELAELIASKRSLLTQMASKEMVDDITQGGAIRADTVAKWDTLQAASSDAREGIAAFLEKRSPDFSWTPGAED